MKIDYTIIRSNKRKTIALQIKNNQVIVRAPNGVSPEYIALLVKQKSAWIVKKLSNKDPVKALSTPTYLPNSSLLIYGIEKKLCVYFQKSPDDIQVTITDSEIHISLAAIAQSKSHDSSYLSTQIKKQLAKWFKEKAQYYLSYRLVELSIQLNITPVSYQVKRYKARWGSCNNKHELSFNYLLVMAPAWVFDYVIVHELCHVKHLNHSPKFWALVEKHMPHYLKASQWLKQNQAKIHW